MPGIRLKQSIRQLLPPLAAFALGWAWRPEVPAGRFQSERSGPGHHAGASRIHPRSPQPQANSPAKEEGSTPGGADIDRLARAFKTSTDPLEIRRAFVQLLAALTPENAREIRALLAPLDSNSAEFRDFHFAWGKVAGIDAVMGAADTPEPDMGPALSGWAAARPSAARNWFTNLDMANDPAFNVLLKERGIPEAELRGYLARGLVTGLAISDGETAVVVAGEIGADGDPAALGLVDLVARQLLPALGAEDAARWAANLAIKDSVPYRRPDGRIEQESVRAAAMRSIAVEFTRGDPASAAAWAAASAAPDAEPWVVREVGLNWARQDPAAAVAWLQSLGDSRGQREGLSAAYAVWANQDPEGSSRSLATLPESTARDFAINGFTAATAHENPAAAVLWAETIANPGLREAATVRAGQRFFSQDPAAAADWLLRSGLGKEAVERVVGDTR